ncbi:hypothetical protein RRG08_006125 [Elysia crispata]|uniref:Uncharacterized protein n=1 Tax=Elysia crispata TaxID=231223 RepID=A0AAE0YJE6_9GAST|nr:hypothetical protein RRG08_006125 [Elysia crispata]
MGQVKWDQTPTRDDQDTDGAGKPRIELERRDQTLTPDEPAKVRVKWDQTPTHEMTKTRNGAGKMGIRPQHRDDQDTDGAGKMGIRPQHEMTKTRMGQVKWDQTPTRDDQDTDGAGKMGSDPNTR